MTPGGRLTVFARQFKQLKGRKGHAMVTCPCGRAIPVRFAYRCYHCGLWMCAARSEEHFGPRHLVPGHCGDPA